ncbi:MAG: phage holin family protein [Catenulispora sp.]
MDTDTSRDATATTARATRPVAPVAPTPPEVSADGSTAALIARATKQLSTLIREELRLAQAEMSAKGRRMGFGGGLFGAAGLMAMLAVQALVAAAVAGLAVVVPVWGAALIVAGGLLVVAAALALAGKKQIEQATPPVPEQTVESVKADLAEIAEGAHR